MTNARGKLPDRFAVFINKRRLIISMVENFELQQKNLIVKWKKPFDIVAERPFSQNSGDDRDKWQTLFREIYRIYLQNLSFDLSFV